MWHEFPYSREVYDIDSQFMIGDALLFAPKINKPSKSDLKHLKQPVDVFLPKTEIWFEHDSKRREEFTGTWLHKVLGDMD